MEFLDESISYTQYQELLKAYHQAREPIVKAKLKNILKMNANRYRIKRKEALIEAIDRERLLITDLQLSETKKHLTRTYRAISTDEAFVGIDKKHIEEVLRNKWSGDNYSSRIWKNNEVVASKLRDELLQSFISGKTFKDISNTLIEYTDYGKFACNRLVRTETSYIVNVAELESSKRRKIKVKKFMATLDKKTSKICREHHETIVLIDKIKVGVNCPPLHPFCRSFMVDLLEGWDYETDDELRGG